MIKIRKFAPPDARAVSYLIAATIKISNVADYAPDILQSLTDYFTPEKILQLNLERECFVAETDNRIVGTIALEDHEIFSFFVHPDFQGEGIGKRLLNEIERTAKTWGVEKILIASSLTAVTFYEKNGYRKNGEDKAGTAGELIGMEKSI